MTNICVYKNDTIIRRPQIKDIIYHIIYVDVRGIVFLLTQCDIYKNTISFLINFQHTKVDEPTILIVN